MSAEPSETTANVEKRSSSNRTRHAPLNDLIVVQRYEPDFQLAVEKAQLANEAIHLRLEGYGNKDVAVALSLVCA